MFRCVLFVFSQLLFLILLVPTLANAQKSDVGNWLIYFGDKKINKKWNWHHELQYRNFNELGDTEQLLLRTGLGYNLTENNNNILLGYAYVYSEPYLNNTDQKTSFNEHRIYEQFITRQSFGRFALLHRYRFEQRFFKDDVKYRFRYFLAVNVALNHKQLTDKTFYLSMYNEVFVNSKQNYFDRNRFYGGLGYKFTKKIRSEIGIMNQSTNTLSRNQFNLITYVNLN